MYAPSACNFQAWKYIIIKSDEKKKCFNYKLIEDAPVGIMVTYRNDIEVAGKKHFDYIQSASASIQNMLLMAHSLGLGSCWICNLPPQKVMKKAFGIPDNFDVIAYIIIGYPNISEKNTAEQMLYHYQDIEKFKKHTRRFSYEQVVCQDVFSSVEGDCVQYKYPRKDMKYYVQKYIPLSIRKLVYKIRLMYNRKKNKDN